MTITTLLDRLGGVRQTGSGRWIARCPAHVDGSPSLSIRALDDGRVLLHDFGGCETGVILKAIGLKMADLFPERLPGSGPAGGFAPTQSRIPPRDLLQILDHETTVTAVILIDVLDGRELTQDLLDRLATAAVRIAAARDEVSPCRTHGARRDA